MASTGAEIPVRRLCADLGHVSLLFHLLHQMCKPEENQPQNLSTGLIRPKQNQLLLENVLLDHFPMVILTF